MINILRGLAAMILGYVAIVGLTSLGFNILLGGRQLYGASGPVLVAGMLVATVAGIVGGLIAGWIGARRGLINAALVLIPLAADTVYVLFFFKGGNAPFWFDAMASATLMLFTLLGGLLSERTWRRATIA